MRLLKILSLPLLLIASLIGFDRAAAQEEPSLNALEFEAPYAAEIFFVPIKPGHDRFYAKGLEAKPAPCGKLRF